ncbi:unnamed protein product [Fraxinus pennsylvanica]|uniref:Uncharacterized protein n=1 Tax=Fraxinus pennsylvanica TaxID=56036 RepID=A0AAD1ZLL8_9LAMI|nr:unnamed protein product [Fraxinus pennsylvanica]
MLETTGIIGIEPFPKGKCLRNLFTVTNPSSENDADSSNTTVQCSLPSKNPSPFSGALSHAFAIKLDYNNHLLQKSMILPVFRGQKLDGNLLGRKPLPNLSSTAAAFIATSESLVTPHGNGARNHLTSDSDNLALKSDYYGKEQLTVDVIVYMNSLWAWKAKVVEAKTRMGIFSSSLMISSSLNGEERNRSPNPDHEEWIVTNQLLMGWLLGSVSEPLLTKLNAMSALSQTSANLFSANKFNAKNNELQGQHPQEQMQGHRGVFQVQEVLVVKEAEEILNQVPLVTV